MYPSVQAYDRGITIFSPDGRLFQVEYAKEAVKLGALALGIVFKDGVTLIAIKSVGSKLIDADSVTKIFKIDSHIGSTSAGLVADARRIIDYLREEAQTHKLIYDEAPTVDYIAREAADVMQYFTQYGGLRPFGVSLLIAGCDEKPKLFEIDPSGALTGYFADAIGANSKQALELLEKEYEQKINEEEAILLGLRVIKKVTNQKLSPANIDIGLIKMKNRLFSIVGDKETQKLIDKV
ncbi:MAG: archaeal proteasome endopeptidase complex subunit alpha [Candidatus Micrarchaeia archaeon]|jgi:proteasome alpha subunit